MKKWITKFLAGLLAAMLLMAPVALMEQNPSEAPVAITEPEPIVAEAIDEVAEEVAIDDMDAIAEEGLFELGADDSDLLFEEIEAELPSEDVTVTNLPLMDVNTLQPKVTFNIDWAVSQTGIQYTGVQSLQAAIDNYKQSNQSAITTVDIQNLADLTGLDTLTSLTAVVIIASGASTIDFSKNNKLEQIYLLDTPSLSSLTLGKQPNLRDCNCVNAKLTSLDVSGCTLIKPFVNDAHKTIMEDNTIVYSQDNPADLGYSRSTNPWLKVDDTVKIITETASDNDPPTTTTETTTTTPVVVSTPPATSTEPITIFKIPTSVKAKAAKKGKVTVSWKKIKKTKKTKALLKQIKSIEVQLSTDPNFATIVQTKNLGKKKTKATFKKLQKNTVYYARVRYVGADGVSNWSATKRVKTKKK